MSSSVSYKSSPIMDSHGKYLNRCYMMTHWMLQSVRLYARDIFRDTHETYRVLHPAGFARTNGIRSAKMCNCLGNVKIANVPITHFIYHMCIVYVIELNC